MSAGSSAACTLSHLVREPSWGARLMALHLLLLVHLLIKCFCDTLAFHLNPSDTAFPDSLLSDKVLSLFMGRHASNLSRFYYRSKGVQVI